MTDTKKLYEMIDGSGLRRGWVAQKLGISPGAFRMKAENKHEFKQTEIVNLAAILHMTTEERDIIFFSDCCTG